VKYQLSAEFAINALSFRKTLQSKCGLFITEVFTAWYHIKIRTDSEFTVFTLTTGSLYILVRYSLTSCFVIRGRTLNTAFAGVVSVGRIVLTSVIGIVGIHILKRRGPSILIMIRRDKLIDARVSMCR